MNPRAALWFWFLMIAVVADPARAAHTKADLLLETKTARPGDTVLVGVRLRMDRGWHTYWRNSGASGMPTVIDWTLPGGSTAGAIQWPLPVKYPEKEFTTYIYTNEVVLLVPLRVPEGATRGTVELKADVSWLECETLCVPGSAEVSGTLGIGADTVPSDAAALLNEWRGRVPPRATNLSARAWWNDPGKDDVRTLMIEWPSASAPTEVDFYPYASETFEIQGNTSREGSDPGKVRLKTTVKRLSGDWPAQVSGVLVWTINSGQQGVEVVLNVESAKGPAAAGSDVPTATPVRQPFGLVLLYAFLGGMILNIMPCVLPVIALKILGFVGQARENPARVRFLGLVYGLGVLASFLVLAALVIGVRAAGQKAGWGMQFGNPQFLVVLTVLMTLVALNLFGLFEITLSGRTMTAADSLASKHGAAGAFFNGVLATALATPCTAPFLSVALGFAFVGKSNFQTVLVFLTIGLGLAFPYVLLSWNPVWLKFVPKPGKWMEHFKVAMGFPMLATALWLISLLPIHYGDRSWWLGIFLLFLAVAAWVYGQFFQRGRSRRGMAAGVALAVATVGYLWAAEGQLNWRTPGAAQSFQCPGAAQLFGSAVGAVEPRGSGVRPGSRQTSAGGFHGDWCLTCKAVKRALESKAVSTRLKELNAVALIGDYTKFPPAITDELNRYGRAGVPLVLVYPPDPSKDALVLPEVLTPGMVVDALQRAIQSTNGNSIKVAGG